MRIRPLLAWSLLAAAWSAHDGAAQPSPGPNVLRVWTARAFATVLAEVRPQFERAAGVRLHTVSGLPAEFGRRALAGEPFDLLISGSATVDDWSRRGRVAAASRVHLARSGIGVAIRAGTQKPDLGSVDAFRRALLGAKSLAWLRVGSELYLDSLFERLELTEALAAKSRRPAGDSVAALVALGKVDLGLVVVTQILTTPGVELAGPLPPEIWSYVIFSAAVRVSAPAADAARQLIRYLQGPEAGRAITGQGMGRPPFEEVRNYD